MSRLNTVKAIKKMSVNKLGYSTEQSFYSMKRLKRKYLLLLASKFIEKVHDTCNAKEHYESFFRKKT